MSLGRIKCVFLKQKPENEVKNSAPELTFPQSRLQLLLVANTILAFFLLTKMCIFETRA
jgi:hypothetical protein